MRAIHPQARTTPAVRASGPRSPESAGVLAKRYGVSTETIRRWRRRGPDAKEVSHSDRSGAGGRRCGKLIAPARRRQAVDGIREK